MVNTGVQAHRYKELSKFIRETCGVGSYNKCVPAFAFNQKNLSHRLFTHNGNI